MKTCTKCGKEKELREFSPDKRKKDGLYARCKVCRVEDCRDHREANRGKVRESSREYGRKNPGRVKKNLAAWRNRNRFKAALQRSRFQAKKRGEKPCSATFDELEAAFTGKCFLCGVPELECNMKLHIDHNHATGEFRGWLCGKCNKGLGLFNDNEELLVDALHYLMKGEIR